MTLHLEIFMSGKRHFSNFRFLNRAELKPQKSGYKGLLCKKSRAQEKDCGREMI